MNPIDEFRSVMKTLLLFLVGVFCLAGYSLAPVCTSDSCGQVTNNSKTLAETKNQEKEISLALDIGVFGVGAAMLSQSGNF